MKKILLLILALLMMLPIVACDKTPAETDPGEQLLDPKEVFDFVLEKDPNKDFVVLNIADPQLNYMLWANNAPQGRAMKHTVTELVNAVKPDFITIAGDYTQNAEARVFREMGLFFDSFGIPWAPIWGNHDYDAYRSESDIRGAKMDIVNKIFTTAFENCLYAPGPAELGNGNYTIGISENGKIVESFIMMDTHSDFVGYWGITEAQTAWYEQKVAQIKKTGCDESIAVMHITPESTMRFDAGGYRADGVGHVELPDYFLDKAVELGHTKTILVGHGHWGWKKDYQGILMVETVATGSGLTSKKQYDEDRNGGTYFKINSDGRCTDVEFKFISLKGVMERDDCLFDE